MKKISALGGATAFLVPALALAANELGNLTSLATSLQTIVNTVIPIVFGLIVIAFFWGLAKYVFSAGDEDSKKDGKAIMIGGIIALFVAASIWGIIAFIGAQLGVGSEGVGDFTGPTINLGGN